MQPAIKIVVNGVDRTEEILSRLIKLSVTDNSGHESDSLSLELDNSSNSLELPEAGAVLALSLGMDSNALVDLGQWTLGHMSLSGPPHRMSLTANAANVTDGLKEVRDRQWGAATIAEAVATIAEAHKLIPVVGSDFVNLSLAGQEQSGESDMNFLTRVARDHGAVSKIVSGRLLFAKKREGKSATGAALPEVEIAFKHVSSYGLSLESKAKYSSVRAHWNDPTGSEARPEILVGDGRPMFTIKRPLASKAEAVSVAQAKLADLNRDEGSLQIGLAVGMPELFAESPFRISGIGYGVDGRWIATQVTHEISTGGFKTRITGER